MRASSDKGLMMDFYLIPIFNNTIGVLGVKSQSDFTKHFTDKAHKQKRLWEVIRAEFICFNEK